MFEQLDPPEPTPRQIEDDEATERQIEDAVCARMRDPAYRIDALSALMTDNAMVQSTLDDLIMGYGDPAVHIGSLRCDLRAELLDWVRRDAERGKL